MVLINMDTVYELTIFTVWSTESERERGRERGSERLWREWRERDKKRGTFTPV